MTLFSKLSGDQAANTITALMIAMLCFILFVFFNTVDMLMERSLNVGRRYPYRAG